ncbi:MAG: PAS domain S-box protein, partial [Thermoplasmata archaeon]|nr:PAS domain S-box protein [Thermoplasmata archaeon]
MREEPDIVKELREAERLGLLQSKMKLAYEKPKQSYEQPKDILDEIASFVDNLQASIQNADTTTLYSEKIYRDIVEQAIVGVVVTWNNKILFCNKKEAELFGYTTPSELIGKEVSEFVHVSDLPRMQRLAEQLRGGKTLSHPVIFRGIRNDGREIYIEAFATVFPFEGKKDSLLSFHLDVTERVKRENLIRNVENRYRLITENANDLIATITFSLTPRYTYVSPSHERIIGYRAEELIGKPIFEFVHPDDREKLLSLIKKYIAFKGKKSLTGEGVDITETIEFRIIDVKGEWHYLETTLNIMGDELLFVSRDITKRKIVEEYFRDLFDNANDLIQSVDSKGRFIYVNKRWLETLGYTEEEVKNLTIFDIIRKDHKSHCKEIIERIIKGESFDRVETVFVAKDGQEIYVEGSINGRFENGKFVSTRAIFRDVTERKKMEFKLRESEARLRALFDATTEMLILVDEDGNILDLNDAMAASLGRKKEEIIGKNLRNYLPHDIFEKRYAHALKVIKTKKPVQFEDERNGRFFHSILYPVFDENGEVHRIAAFIKDITEEKKMQIQLKESEERYRSVMETAADGILIVDETLRIISGNKSAARIFGYSKKELSGKPLWEIMPKRLKNNFLRGIKKLDHMDITKFSKRTIEVVGLRKDGKEIPIELSFSMYEINGRRYFTSIIRDASERKKIEEELREREEKYRTIFETSPEAIVLFDRHGHIVDVNDRVRNWLGYTRKELIGKSIEKLPALSQESKKIAMRRFSQRFQKRKISSYDLEFITKSGAVVIGRVRGTVMEDSDGRITGVLVMISDITEQKQFEE